MSTRHFRHSRISSATLLPRALPEDQETRSGRGATLLLGAHGSQAMLVRGKTRLKAVRLKGGDFYECHDEHLNTKTP